MRPITHLSRTIFTLLGLTLFWLPFSGQVFGQSVPDAGLQLQTLIPVPNWGTGAAGTTAASWDIITFNPVTRVFYIADRNNHGATAIDTKTWRAIGSIALPGCAANSACSPSGVGVAPDLQKLLITDRDMRAYIYDLRVPGQGPAATLIVPAGPDEMDYDPLNHRYYFGNTTGPSFNVNVVDMVTNTYVGAISLPAAPENPRFNPVDGHIYVPVPGVEVDEIDPQQGTAGAIVRRIPFPASLLAAATCCNSFDIDPTTNTAVTASGQIVALDIPSGTYTPLLVGTGVDIGFFNPHNRRWYFGARLNGPTSAQNCPKDNATPPLTSEVAVVAEANPSGATLIGGSCTGRAARAAGVDPFQDNVYVPTPQYPSDPTSATTGSAGVLVFHDPAPADDLNVSGGNEEGHSQAVLTPVAGSGVMGTVDFTLRRRNMSVEASLTGLPATIVNTVLVVTTTVGNESINCGVDGRGNGYCEGYVYGDPLIGGVVDVGSNGTFVAQGHITLITPFPSFISAY